MNIKPTTHSRKDNDPHGNRGVVKRDSDVQYGTVMAGTRDAVAEGHKFPTCV